MRYIFLCWILVSFSCKAQEFSSSLIPDSLKENADAVLRKESLIVVITDFDKAIIKHKYVITILNENGKEYAAYKEQYDKLNILSDIVCNMYDSNGIKIKTAKKKDIYDVSDNGNNFNTDTRVKAFYFKSNSYPYTVEFEDEQTLNGIYHLPSWRPIINTNFAVQQSSLEVETFLDYGLRFKQVNFFNKPIITQDKKSKYFWELKNMKALEYESLMPNFSEIFPFVLLAPSKFSIEGYNGDMTSWNALGKFNLLLNKNRDILPNNIKQIVHEITDSLQDDYQKIQKLYHYQQQNTRYISIQLGIGGWQPLDAKFVSEKKYGDCKALSNFMICLLKEAKIKAYYTVIKSGENVTNGLYEDFPMSNFNHIITCVPLYKDTMWLECTSQTESAGYTGTFTGNRKAMMITDSGGVVVSTPKYNSNNNKAIRKAIINIDEEGNAKINTETLLTGIKQNDAHTILYEKNNEEKKKYYNNMLNLGNYEIEKNNAVEKKGCIPEILESLDIYAPFYANVTSKRLFISPNIFNKIAPIADDKNRKFNIEIKQSFKEIDTIKIKIPEGYMFETIPEQQNIVTQTYKYKTTYEFSNDVLTYYRFFEQNAKTFLAKEFDLFYKTYNQIFNADRIKLVFVKK